MIYNINPRWRVQFVNEQYTLQTKKWNGAKGAHYWDTYSYPRDLKASVKRALELDRNNTLGEVTDLELFNYCQELEAKAVDAFVEKFEKEVKGA